MLRLKEKPIEWIKFTAVIGFVLNVILWLLWKRDGLPIAVPMTAAVTALLAVTVAAMRPRWFRGFYRGGMTISFQIGQVIGKILLTLFFFLFVTPLGLLLRLFGKDLLLLKQTPDHRTYWHTARNNREFDRMF
jgi:riboflavin transporter FmnP